MPVNTEIFLDKLLIKFGPKIYLILILMHAVAAETHSLRYFYTVTSGIPNFPEFVDVGMLNGQVISYYDSITKKKVPKQDWMEENFDQQYWDSSTKTVQEAERINKGNIQLANQIFNQTKGVFQTMYGCEWDEETGSTGGFHQSGYDGKDFLAFDLKTKSWIAAISKAVHTKMKWESNPSIGNMEKDYLTQECIHWLKKYVNYGRSSLMRTAPPSVSLIQKTPSSPVTCHATGFYPSRVMVTWQKDGQELNEDVELGETLPNDDGTFQKSVQLNVKPEERKNNQYQCVVQVSGINKDFIRNLPGEGLFGPAFNPGPIIGGLVGVVILAIIAVVFGVIIWKKKNSKPSFVKANTSDTDSENSGQKA
ncbi:hypothetical protein UPYG_G00338920 [Umbra pygmaea]|uniref:Ig-like domain-containing protein n=1 Tax=Umbra pygmaea TaxID=75934 RepID=A0ABD0W0Q8_UMBPY